MKVLKLAALLLILGWTCSEKALAKDTSDELFQLKARVAALESQKGVQPESAPSAGPSFNGNDVSETAPVISEMEQEISTLEHELLPETLPCESDWAEESNDDLEMSASWHHGLEMATQDGDFRVHVGGRTQFDAGWFSVDENVQENINIPYQDGVDFRRGRLRVDGTMYGNIDWAVEYDFFNAFRIDGVDRTVTAPTDLWWTFKEVPCFGNIRIGNHKPAIGFEHLVSSRFLPLMERSFNQDTFYGGAFNGFWPGISSFDTYGHDDIGTWNVGLFKPTNNVFATNATDGDYAVVSRLTWLPWYECQGAELFHLGASVLQSTTVNDRIVFRTRDAIRTGLASAWPVPATTGEIFGDDMQWINGELAAVCGPWTFQAEYLTSYLHDAAPIVAGVVQPSVGTVNYHGGYAQIFVFLTGEHERYNKQMGVFDRVIPHENVSWEKGRGGSGAWQLGARYNYLDLNDAGINGGVLNNFTAGLNWFWNPNFKIQFDYFATHRDAPLAGELGDGWIHGWGTRVAHDF